VLVSEGTVAAVEDTVAVAADAEEAWEALLLAVAAIL
jgi:hypothetical protein